MSAMFTTADNSGIIYPYSVYSNKEKRKEVLVDAKNLLADLTSQLVRWLYIETSLDYTKFILNSKIFYENKISKYQDIFCLEIN